MEGFHLPQRKISLQKQPSKAFERKMFLAISQKLQESTCARVPFLIKLQASASEKRDPDTGVFM